MGESKTRPGITDTQTFLNSVSEQRQSEANILIDMMSNISKEAPVMWGPSIVGFGSKHYKYETGREGDMPRIGFSPRKASITVYFSEGFDNYGGLLKKLGKHKTSISCLYINKLADVDLEVLGQMLEQSYHADTDPAGKPTTVDEYVARVPTAARPLFDELRSTVKNELPQANEVLSYGIIGYKTDNKRARVFISGWNDHVAMYPIPKDETLRKELKPYIKGKGTLWLPLDQELPEELIARAVRALARS